MSESVVLRRPFESAGCSGEPVVTTRVLSTFAHEAAGAAGTRHSLRPLFFGSRNSHTTRAYCAAGLRERGLVFEARGLAV